MQGNIRVSCRVAVVVVLCLLFSFTSKSHASRQADIGVLPIRSDAAIGLGGGARLLLAQTLSTTFDGFRRFPAEEGYWMQMTKPSGETLDASYFRDALVGGWVSINGAADNETWTADLTYPDGTTAKWSILKFYKTYLGAQDCFVYGGLLGGWSECNTGGSMAIIFYIKGQCRQPGTWSMRFYDNGVPFHTGQFKLLPQIPEKTGTDGEATKVPLYSQLSYTDHYDSICRTTTCSTALTCDLKCAGAPNEIKVRISQEGCYLTNAAMILSYHGATVTPPVLNTWLNANNGYYNEYNPKTQKWIMTGRVDPVKVVEYAGSRGVAMSYDNDVSPPADAWAGLSDYEKYICAYGPQMGKIDATHWAVLTGMNQARTLYAANDPAKAVPATVAVPSEIRKFSGPEYTYRDRTGIDITFFSPGELLITDPLGRRLGYDPINKAAYNEMPGFYGSDTQHDDETGEVGHESKELRVSKPMDGDYTLQIIGTGADSYGVHFRVSGDWNGVYQGKEVERFRGSITPGEIHSYGLNFVRAVGPTLAFFGGFDGGGQRPKDVNKFLSYISPTISQTKLPAGTTSFDLMISYAKESLSATFRAVLNGVDVTSSFKPVPGGHETVVIPLAPGRNVLVLSVDGQLPTRTATDTDRLTFVVQ